MEEFLLQLNSNCGTTNQIAFLTILKIKENLNLTNEKNMHDFILFLQDVQDLIRWVHEIF